MFIITSAAVMNKVDLLSSLHFEVDRLSEATRGINQKASFFPASCTQGNSIPEWVSWLLGEMGRR